MSLGSIILNSQRRKGQNDKIIKEGQSDKSLFKAIHGKTTFEF